MIRNYVWLKGCRNYMWLPRICMQTRVIQRSVDVKIWVSIRKESGVPSPILSIMEIAINICCLVCLLYFDKFLFFYIWDCLLLIIILSRDVLDLLKQFHNYAAVYTSISKAMSFLIIIQMSTCTKIKGAC